MADLFHQQSKNFKVCAMKISQEFLLKLYIYSILQDQEEDCLHYMTKLLVEDFGKSCIEIAHIEVTNKCIAM